MINEELQAMIKHMNPIKTIKIKVNGKIKNIKSLYFDKDKNIIISDKKDEDDQTRY
jgi:hypothetical protein